MNFEVPQFIETEDKIAFQLTAKQLGWLAIDGVILLVLWNILDFSAFVLAGIFSTAIFASLAFLKPHGLPLIHFVVASFQFTAKPKIYVWKRTPERITFQKKALKKKASAPTAKQYDPEKAQEISKILDK